MTAPVMTVDDAVVDELEAIMNEPGSVLTGVSSRANRARVPAPFPLHRWAEHMPAVVVLPRTAQQVSEIIKLANRAKIPVVPRAGGTGLNDGAVLSAEDRRRPGEGKGRRARVAHQVDGEQLHQRRHELHRSPTLGHRARDDLDLPGHHQLLPQPREGAQLQVGVALGAGHAQGPLAQPHRLRRVRGDVRGGHPHPPRQGIVLAP